MITNSTHACLGEATELPLLSDKTEAIQKELIQGQQRKFDKTVVPTELTVEDRASKEIWVTGGKEVLLTNLARGQYLRLLGIPVRYINKCPHYLSNPHIRYWTNIRGGHILLRMRTQFPTIPHHVVRGICSTRFNTNMDDHIVFPMAIRQLLQKDKETARLHEWLYNDDVTLMRVIFSDTMVEYNGQKLWPGVLVMNSEVGLSSFIVTPLIISSSSYYNYYGFSFLDRRNEGTTNVRHIRPTKLDRVQGAIPLARHVAEVGIHRLLEADREIVEKPLDTVKQIVKDSDFLGEWVVAIVEEDFKLQKEISRLKLAKSILYAVKDLPAIRQYRAQQEVGRYLRLFENTENRLQTINNDITDITSLT